jgi:hypothetical protein
MKEKTMKPTFEEKMGLTILIALVFFIACQTLRYFVMAIVNHLGFDPFQIAYIDTACNWITLGVVCTAGLIAYFEQGE